MIATIDTITTKMDIDDTIVVNIIVIVIVFRLEDIRIQQKNRRWCWCCPVAAGPMNWDCNRL